MTLANGLVLGLFAKAPRPGQVKTRLAAVTSPEWAACVAEAFLLDLLVRLSQLEVARILAYSPAQEELYFRNLVGDRFALAPQAEGDLGRRMATFLAEQFQVGARAVVLLGTDSPTVPRAFIEQAFRELERADMVLGPATDGGYYLLGCARQVPPVFEEIAWSSSGVLGDTVRRLSDPRWRLAVLPPWYDVDTLDDWRMLQGHLAALRRAGCDPGVPCTEQLVPEPATSCS
jgi:rSAM/selenodomain-associated transferase 1